MDTKVCSAKVSQLIECSPEDSFDAFVDPSTLRIAFRAGVFSLMSEFEHQLVESTLLAPQLLKKNVHQFTFQQSEKELGSSVDWWNMRGAAFGGVPSWS